MMAATLASRSTQAPKMRGAADADVRGLFTLIPGWPEIQKPFCVPLTPMWRPCFWITCVELSRTVMYAAGHQAEEALEQTIEEGFYLSSSRVPSFWAMMVCTAPSAGAPRSIFNPVSRGAAAIVSMGSCACYGTCRQPAPTPRCGGRSSVISDRPVINMSGCPVNAVNVSALVTYYVTYGTLPEVDRLGRPLFAYSARIHDTCQRRAYFDAGLFVETWGDEGHELGYCLYKMGCKGPATYHNCGIAMYNDRTSWPVAAGHGCIGCSEPAFFDRLASYERLQTLAGLGESTPSWSPPGVVGASAVAWLRMPSQSIRGQTKETPLQNHGENKPKKNLSVGRRIIRWLYSCDH